MSKRKILSALKKKNISPSRVEYMRGCPTPSGYANGWDLDFPEHLEDVIYELDSGVDFSSSMEFDDLESVMNWIEELPIIVVISEQAIIDNAPDGSTHFANGTYLKIEGNSCKAFNSLNVWSLPISNIEEVFLYNNPRLLDDIKRIALLSK